MTNTETIQHQLNTLLASKNVYTYIEETQYKDDAGEYHTSDAVIAEFKPLSTSEDPIRFVFLAELMEPAETAGELYWLLNSFADGKGYQYSDGATSYTEDMLLTPAEVTALEQLAKDLRGAK